MVNKIEKPFNLREWQKRNQGRFMVGTIPQQFDFIVFQFHAMGYNCKEIGDRIGKDYDWVNKRIYIVKRRMRT